MTIDIAELFARRERERDAPPRQNPTSHSGPNKFHTAQGRLWVKLGRTQYEHMFSALPSNSDIARRSRHVSNVPTAVIRTCAAHNDGFRALVQQPVWHEFRFAGGIYEIVSEHAAGSA